ncbi:hypothetical protein ACO1O0_004318 [Amphichorda felina]
MSQDLEYPLLSAASYERPPKSCSTDNTSTSSMSSQRLRTLSDSPIKRAASNESLNPPSSSVTTVTEVSLTPSDMRAMNDALAQARQNGEMPHTTSSPMDVQAVVEDYGFLTRLHEVRGDVSTDIPKSYAQLRVEVTRRIRERDSALSEEETKREAARRVNNYLRSIEQERYFFDAATASPRSVHSKSSCSHSLPAVDVETLGEELLSIVEQAADQTLVDATEPLRSDLRCFKGQNDIHNHNNGIHNHHNDIHSHHNNTFHHLLQRQEDAQSYNNDTFRHLLQHQEDITEMLSSMIDPQSKLIHTTSRNLSLLTDLTTHLSQVVMNLAPAVTQIVANASQQHAQEAIRQVMEVQQQAMFMLAEEESRQKRLNHDILAAKVVEKLQAANITTASSNPKGGRSLSKALKRMFRR